MRDKSKEKTLGQVYTSEDSFVVKEYCHNCSNELNSTQSFTGKQLQGGTFEALRDSMREFKSTCPCGSAVESDIVIVALQ